MPVSTFLTVLYMFTGENNKCDKNVASTKIPGCMSLQITMGVFERIWLSGQTKSHI